MEEDFIPSDEDSENDFCYDEDSTPDSYYDDDEDDGDDDFFDSEPMMDKVFALFDSLAINAELEETVQPQVNVESDPDSDKEMEDIIFNGPIKESPSASLLASLKSFTESEIFFQYIKEEERTNWARWTNERVKQLENAPRPEFYFPNNVEKFPWPPKWIVTWEELTVDDINVWLALTICRAIYCKGISITEIWSNTHLRSYEFTKFMKRDRFQAINSALCVCNPAEYQKQHDNPYFKIFGLLERFSAVCQDNYVLSQHISRDEQCVMNCHKTSLAKKRMKKKFIQNGIVLS